MAWRFKVSKYKNAAVIPVKKEDWISDIKVGAPTSCGNHIKASAAFVAFNVENRGGGSLGIVPLDFRGRLDSSAPLLHGHSDLITDFDFSPYDDGMLATCSSDAYVRIWHIPKSGLKTNLTEPEYSLPQFDKRIETVLFHPTTDFLLTFAYFNTVKLWDIKSEKQIYCFNDHEDQVQSVSWKGNGSLFTTTSKDKFVRVIDPRLKVVAQQTESHKICKDSRVVWLGDSERVLTTGFDAYRTRELKIRDIRNFNKPLKVQSFDSSTGILIPLFDADTNMLFLAGKADVTVMYWEVTEKDPFLTEGLKHNGTAQTKGACLVPKRGLNSMNGEVNRVLQLTSNAILPLSYQVPRKTYREFHSDLFPDTEGYNASCSISQWNSGCNNVRKRISLNPSHYEGKNLLMFRKPLSERRNEKDEVESTLTSDNITNDTPVAAPRSSLNNGIKLPSEFQKENCRVFSNMGFAKPFVAVKPSFGPVRSNLVPKPATRSAFPIHRDFISVEKDFLFNKNSHDVVNGDANCKIQNEENINGNNNITNGDSEIMKKVDRLKKNDCNAMQVNKDITDSQSNNIALERKKEIEKRVLNEAPPSPTPRRIVNGPTRSFRRICKFRHLKGTPVHKNQQIDNLRDINRTIPGECNGIAANSTYAVLPLSGAGGKLSVINHTKGGRLPDGVIPSFVNGATVLDFSLNPFDENRLIAACDDGKIKMWRIPNGGLRSPTNVSVNVLADSAEKVTIVLFHPLACNVLAVACGDFLVRIWDLEDESVALVLHGHQDLILALAWSPCGQFLASVCRDGKIRVYDPRKSLNPNREGPGPLGVRGARILWALDGDLLIVCGFSKISERQVMIFKSNDVSRPLNTVTIDVSPSILIPSYDADSSTLFLTGKGDSTVYAYEVGSDFPHLFQLSHHRAGSVHQAFVILPKLICNVRNVEFCKALRLSHSVLEPISFTVPRVKTEFFQDDLFPPTRLTNTPVMTSSEWLNGINRQPKLVSLKPEEMQSLSEKREGNNSPLLTSSGQTIANINANSVRKITPPFMSSNGIECGAKETQQKLENSLNQKIGVSESIVQDRMEGVDASEWD